VAEDFLVEGIKLVGGVAGIGTALFTFYDRAIKGRPIANVSATKQAPGLPTEFRLTVRNPAGRDIIIREINSNRPELIIGSDETATSLFAASEGVRYKAIIGADAERWFRMYFKSDDPADLPVSIEILWRPVTAYWLDRRPIVLRLTTGLLRDLEEEAERRRVAAAELKGAGIGR
jgi:hypothetical protein